jgi:hypothetical protein
MTQVLNQPHSVGDEIGPLTKIASLEETKYFAKLSRLNGRDGRFLKENNDIRQGLENGIEEAIIVSSWQSMGYLTQLITNWMPYNGFLASIDIRFRRVIKPNDILICKGIITDILQQTDQTLVMLDVFIENQNSERPLQAVAEILFSH